MREERMAKDDGDDGDDDDMIVIIVMTRLKTSTFVEIY